MLTLKRSGENSPLEETFEEATERGKFNYWLQQEDISDIARIKYNGFKNPSSPDLYMFEISGSIEQLKQQIKNFQAQFTAKRLTLIINLDNRHWVTLVVLRSNNHFDGLYIDSLGVALSYTTYELLREFGITSIDFSTCIHQQADDFNCGLWSLENAADINRVLDNNKIKASDKISEELHFALRKPRNLYYFNSLRRTLTFELRSDALRNERYKSFDNKMELVEPGLVQKRVKIQALNIDDRLERFVESFMDIFQKKIAAANLIAKGQKLSIEALKHELKLGATGALFGFVVSQGMSGTVSSLVASLRTVSNEYYFARAKSQKINRIFSNVNLGDLSSILAKAAVEIFISFEAQFMQVTDKAGDVIAIEKLAEDAVTRIFNYISEKYVSTISSELITEAILLGDSEKYFDPSLKKLRLSVSGHEIQDIYGNKLFTADIFEKIGLFVQSKTEGIKFYKKKSIAEMEQYGFRRALSWEIDVQGKLAESYLPHYKEIYPHIYVKPSLFRDLRTYQYVLESTNAPIITQSLLSKLISRAQPEILEKSVLRKSILFDLRKPVENFIGRKKALDKIHHTLMQGHTSTIVSALSKLDLSKENWGLTGSSPASLSGLGGIGKTQLALRYAQLYADSYDNNVLWINCDSRLNLAHSFNKLAKKLEIETKDRYGENKPLEFVVEEIYEYFTDSKSLFIFDNVENYLELAPFLPKLMLDNKPYVLITSRFTNWQNAATVVSLEVFTYQEALDLLKLALSIKDNAQDLMIKELNTVLQGLPLALQQAIAYIKNQQNIVSSYSLENYLEIYKTKSKEILDFNFREHTNDPYLKTVFTTWQITLEKIQEKGKIGLIALEILSIMSFIHPENIYAGTFIELFSPDELGSALHLLKVYSMTSTGRCASEFVVHRLVQRVVNLDLQNFPSTFKEIAMRTESLIIHYGNNMDTRFHYLAFLLNVVEHPELEPYLITKLSLQKFSSVLMIDDVNVWVYFFDFIYSRFPKKKYVTFLNEAFFNYRKEAAPFYIKIVLSYIEEKMLKGILNKSDLKEIIENNESLSSSRYRIKKFSNDKRKRALQLQVCDIIISFKRKMFPEDFQLTCPYTKRRRATPEHCGLGSQLKERRQKYARYIERINHIAGIVSTGLFTKDTLAAILQGDFEAVAINFGLLLGGQFLQSVSKDMLLTGERLTLSESDLLEKELVKNNVLKSLLINEDIIFPVKKRLLGGMLKIASPFVAHGSSVFFIYNLYKDIHDYQLGDIDRLDSIISNSGIIALEGIETSLETLEALKILTDVTAFTNPVGGSLQVLIWLSAEIYEINRSLNAINQHFHLSLSEKILQGLRMFFLMGPSKYIEIKEQNYLLAEQGFYFLKEHPSIKRFVFLAASARHKKREVRLDKQFNLTLSETVPEDFCEGKIICAEGALSRPTIFSFEPRNEKTNTYFCKNALGIEYDLDRAGNVTLIALTQGEDKVVVKSDSFTIFLIEAGNKHYKGSDYGNLFVLQSNLVVGLLEGGHGVDVLNLENFYANSDTSILIDRNGFLCENTMKGVNPRCVSEEKVSLKRINHIYGRTNKKDIIFLTKDFNLIDANGGENEENADIIYVTNEAAENLQVVLRANTMVHYLDINLAPNPVNYRIPHDRPGHVRVKFPFQDDIQQRFFFDFPIENILSITVEKHLHRFIFSMPETGVTPNKKSPLPLNRSLLIPENIQPKLFSLSLQDEIHLNTLLGNKSIYIPKNAHYVFHEAIELQLLDQKHVYAKVGNSNNIDKTLTRFIRLAHQLKKSFSIQFNNKQTAFIGSKTSEVFIVDCLTENYLVGNGGENVYILAPKNLTTFALPEIILWDSDVDDANASRDTLDLRPVIEKARVECSERSILNRVSQEASDLVLRLNTDTYSDLQCHRLNTTWPIVTIRFKNALLTEWYQKLNIFLEDSQARQFFYTQAKGWFLIAAPLVFDETKEIIILTMNDIRQHGEIMCLKKRGNFTFFKRNETDLIIASAHTLTDYYYDVYSILFTEFYQLAGMRETVLSLTINFLDEMIYLNDYIERIASAADFYSSVVEDSVPPAMLPRNKRAVTTFKKDIAQPWLTNLSIPLNNKSWAVGIVTLSVSALAFVMYMGHFLAKRLRRVNENPILLSLTSAAVLTAQVDTTTAQAQVNANILTPTLSTLFNTAKQCLRAETSIGLIGFCINDSRIIYWSQTQVKEILNYESYCIDSIESTGYFLSFKNAGEWMLDQHTLNNMYKASLNEIYPLLPLTVHKKLSEKQHQQSVYASWQRQVLLVINHYLASIITLHTPIGNLFKTFGLSIDWHVREDLQFLNRFLITTQQVFLHHSALQKSQTLFAGLLEIALLQPSIQKAYSRLTNGKDFRQVKLITRFSADLLQLGFYNVIHLARLLEWYFPKNESIWKISLGLHIVNSFYSLTGDLSYWYLGMSTFVLPFLPLLLENVGIPMTRGLHTFCNKLIQVFISQSVLNQFSEDVDRTDQLEQTLLHADVRVSAGRNRLKGLLSSKLSFFAQNDSYQETLPKVPLTFKNYP